MIRHLHRNGFHLEELCSAFGVSRSGYYAHLHKPEGRRREEDRQLRPRSPAPLQRAGRLTALRACAKACGAAARTSPAPASPG